MRECERVEPELGDSPGAEREGGQRFAGEPGDDDSEVRGRSDVDHRARIRERRRQGSILRRGWPRTGRRVDESPGRAPSSCLESGPVRGRRWSGVQRPARAARRRRRSSPARGLLSTRASTRRRWSDLGQARRAAVAQRNFDELLEVYELAHAFSRRSRRPDWPSERTAHRPGGSGAALVRGGARRLGLVEEGANPRIQLEVHAPGRESPIDGNGLTRDEGRLVGDEERRNGSDLPRLRDAP